MNVVYAKYSRQRLPRFQTETTILLMEDGTYVVRKKPCNKEAQEHVAQIFRNYLLLKDVTRGLNVAEARANENDVTMDYIQGKSLDKIIFELVRRRDKEILLAQIKSYVNLIKNAVPGTLVSNFSPRQEFINVFGDGYKGKRAYCLEIGNADLIFENIIRDERGRYHVIDYEWVFGFPVPIDIILYRSVVVLWYKYNKFLNGLVTWEELMSSAGLPLEDLDLMRQADLSFQSYVYGSSHKYWIGSQYMKPRISVRDILDRLDAMEKVISDFDKILGQKDEVIAEKENSIREVTETLNDIYSSRTWQMADRVKKFRASLFKRKK